MKLRLKLEDAIVYVLAMSGRGMTTSEIADAINHNKLHIRADGNFVSDKQVYAAICRNPTIFAKESGRILLCI